MSDRIRMYKKYTHPNFSFPTDFIDFISYPEPENIEPWFLFDIPVKVDFWCTKIRELYHERNLIPFAKLDYSDDIVCFDGDDTSGNPKVYYVHAFASPGWEDRGYIDNFTEWLKLARIQSTFHKSE